MTRVLIAKDSVSGGFKACLLTIAHLKIKIK